MSPDIPAASSRLSPETASAMVPTSWTVFLRTFLPWQAVRFLVINLKMVRLIWHSH